MEMDSRSGKGRKAKPHAVCVPVPAQGHVNPMFQFAKLLHSKGFHITFVNSEDNQKWLLGSRSSSTLQSLPDFVFHSISHGVPPASDTDATHHGPSPQQSFFASWLVPFRNLLGELNDPNSGVPPVTCVVSDGLMTFTLDAAQEIGVPQVILWAVSAPCLLGTFYLKDLVSRGLVPLKDINQLNDKEFMDGIIEGLPGFEDIRFRELLTHIRTADADNFMLNTLQHEVLRASTASSIVINTFHELDRPIILDTLALNFPPIYTVGPMTLLLKEIPQRHELSIGSNLWMEDRSCLEWLESKPANSVMYVSFGSVSNMTNQQVVELAWGLASSKHDFLWVFRPDVVQGGPAVLLPEGFVEETKGRGLVVSWCPQEEVLRHPAVGGFLTHCGWNSTLESVCAGVPTVCWPFFGDQQMNSKYSCEDWGIGVEIENDISRGMLEGLIKEVMCGEKGKQMRVNALKLKERAIAASVEGGSSFLNFDRLVKDISRM